MKYFNLVIFTCLFFTISIFAKTNSADTVKTSSGLKYIVVKKGNGLRAKKGNEVVVHYTGTLLDETKFDSSRDNNKPIKFEVLAGKMIPGFDEGISYMKEGDEFRFIIPSKLGYGENGSGKIPPNATLIFDVELISVKDFGLPTADTLWTIFEKSGIDAALEKYNTLRKNKDERYDLREKQLLKFGSQLLLFGKFDEAIKVFDLGKSYFPKSGYIYDSLGEAYVMQFDIKTALEYYHKALEMDSTIINSKKMITLLEQSPQPEDNKIPAN